MTKISVVINTRNEEQNLPKTLKSIKNLADEIVVVDMESSDGTVAIAKKAGAKVFNHKQMGYVEPARNYAISKATNEWVLILDADEEIPETLAKKLKDVVSKNEGDYYRLPRKNIIFGKWIKHSRWWPDYNIRFFKKGKVSWSEIIHSVPETEGKGLDLEALEKNCITHNNYSTLEQYISRMNNYTTQHAALLVKDGYQFDWIDLIKKPTNEFLSRYFFGHGYKDGLHGLALAGLQGLSEFVQILKVWQMDKFKEQDVSLKQIITTMKESESEVSFWQADVLLNEHGGIIQRVKRKLKLR